MTYTSGHRDPKPHAWHFFMGGHWQRGTQEQSFSRSFPDRYGLNPYLKPFERSNGVILEVCLLKNIYISSKRYVHYIHLRISYGSDGNTVGMYVVEPISRVIFRTKVETSSSVTKLLVRVQEEWITFFILGKQFRRNQHP